MPKIGKEEFVVPGTEVRLSVEIHYDKKQSHFYAKLPENVKNYINDQAKGDTYHVAFAEAKKRVLEYYDGLKNREKIILYKLDLYEGFQTFISVPEKISFKFRLAYKITIDEDKTYLDDKEWEQLKQETRLHDVYKYKELEFNETNLKFCNELKEAIETLIEKIQMFFGEDNNPQVLQENILKLGINNLIGGHNEKN